MVEPYRGLTHPLLFVVLCSCLVPSATLVNRDAVKTLIDKSVEILIDCAKEAPAATKSRETFLKCTSEKQSSSLRLFPKEIFEVLFDESALWRTSKQTTEQLWSRLNPESAAKQANAAAEEERKMLKTDKVKGETFDAAKRAAKLTKEVLAGAQSNAKDAFTEYVLDHLPSEIIGRGGKSPMAEMEKIRLRDKEKTFENLFTTRFKEIKVLGDGSNKLGIAFLVEDNNPKAVEKEPVLKVVMAKGNQPQEEFELQKELDEKDWSKVKDYDAKGAEKTIEDVSQEKFIPHVITVDQSHDNDHIFDYIVMQRVGITIKEWISLPKEDTRRPTNDELIHVLSRMYSILNAIHAAGFRHGDNHFNNWALSRTNQAVLYLFDFGRTKRMTDFTWIATDWARWVRIIQIFANLISDERMGETKLKVKPAQLKLALNDLHGKLTKELKKILWTHPDKPTRKVPFQELFAAKYKDVLQLEGFKEF